MHFVCLATTLLKDEESAEDLFVFLHHVYVVFQVVIPTTRRVLTSEHGLKV